MMLHLTVTREIAEKKMEGGKTDETTGKAEADRTRRSDEEEAPRGGGREEAIVWLAPVNVWDILF